MAIKFKLIKSIIEVIINEVMKMKKKKAGYYDFADLTAKNTCLLVTMGKKDGKVNVMALDWKTIGELWSYPICTVAVDPSRYTFSLLNDLPEFTLNVPSPEISSAISIAGSYSGRNTDKIKKAGLKLIESKNISVPMLEEAMISYECKVIHTAESGNICSHRLFFGEILAVYADETLKNR
jgi:flavin reductase (DIM6/NTAB) family NADH-FMN oxidoreductase RutF